MEQNEYFDYTDNFSEIVHAAQPISAKELAYRLFCAPQWVIALIKFRNAIVKPLGLKGEKSLYDLINVESENRATLSKNDKHLDFKVTLMTESFGNGNQRISVGTKVCFHNSMGKVYFAIIKPFHVLICKTLIKRARKNFELS